MSKTKSVYLRLSEILENEGAFQTIIDNANEKYNNEDWKMFSRVMPLQLSRQWNNILDNAEISVMASTLGENDPTPMRAVQGFEKQSGSIPVIGHGFKFGIRDTQEMRDVNMVEDAMLTRLYQKFFDRTSATVQGFHSRLNYWIYQILNSGAMSVDATNSPDGVPFEIKYNVPSENFRVAKGAATAKWTNTTSSSTADPIADIRLWMDIMKKKNVNNPVMVMTENTYLNFILHPNVIKQLANLNKFSTVEGIANINRDDLWRAIKTTFGLPSILPIDAKFMVEKDGVPTELACPLADNKIALLDIDNAFNVHQAYQSILDQHGANISTTTTENGMIAVLRDSGDRAIETTIEMQAYVAPVLNEPKKLLIADVDKNSTSGILS